MSCEKNCIGLCGDNRQGQKCSQKCPKLAVVNRLAELTDGAIQVSFAHNVFYGPGREDSMGHLYSCSLSAKVDEDFLYLDDRGPDSLEVQLVKELRKIASFYRKLATEAEKRLQTSMKAVA